MPTVAPVTIIPRRVFRSLLSPIAGALVAAVALTLAAPAAEAQRDGYRSRIDTTFAFERSGLLDLSHISGDVVVTTWDRAEVHVRAYAQYGRIEPNFSRSRVTLQIEGEPYGGRRNNVRIGESRYDITVPRGARVKIATVSGDVRVEGTQGEVQVGTVSGEVRVSETGGLTTLSTVSGGMIVRGVEGDLAVGTVSGDVTVRDVNGEIRLKSVSGELDLRSVRSRSVSARTTSGEITYEGGFESGGRYEFTAHSGDVTLIVPADASANMTIETFSGSLQTDFAVTLGGGARRGARPRTLDFQLGGGGARVQVTTFSGDAVLRRTGGR